MARLDKIWTGRETFAIGKRQYRVTKFLEEPNAGLITVTEETHPLKYSFTIPAAFVEAIVGLEARKNAITKMCDIHCHHHRGRQGCPWLGCPLHGVADG